MALAAPAVAATEVNVTNLAATLVNPPSGSTIGVTDTVTLEWTFDVPASASAGDTTVFTVPGYLVGAVNGLDVKDDSGTVIGSITGSQQTFTLTYADYVDTHDNVNGKIRLAFSPRETVWGNNTTRDISVTNGTTTAAGGQLTLVYSTVSIFSESSTLAQQNSTWQTDFLYNYSSPTFKVTDVGVKQTTTFNIDDDTQSKATFNCDAIKSTTVGRGVRYFYGPDKSQVTAYSANSASDPLGMEVVACTPTSVTVSYTVAEAGMGFTLSLASSLTSGDAVSLSDEAIATQYTGPYKVHTVRTPDVGTGNTTRAQSRYDFSSAMGGGTQSPKASIVAYIADSDPGTPTGHTTDGQNSDANDGSPVTLEPGQQTVSVVVTNTGAVAATNTGAVAATSGKLLDSVSGAEIGQTGPLAAGETKVYQFTVDVPAGTYRNVYTVMLEGTNGGSGPKSDEVNVTASWPTPPPTTTPRRPTTTPRSPWTSSPMTSRPAPAAPSTRRR